MKNSIGRPLVLAFVCIVVLIQIPVFAKEWSAEQRDVLASFDKYLSVVRQGNLKEMVNFWHPKYVGWDYAQALPVNYDVSLKGIEDFHKNYKFKKLDYDPLEIQVEGNIAILHVNYHVIVIDSTSQEMPSSGRETIILVKRDKKWVMISLVWLEK